MFKFGGLGTTYHVYLGLIGKRVGDFLLVLIELFTALHVMQTRYCDEISVCPSVCLSVCPSVRLFVTRVDCDKMVVRSLQIYIPDERTFSLVF